MNSSVSSHARRTVTRWLADARAGTSSFDQVLPLIYDELHALASAQMRHERASHTLQPTALVHEAYLRLVGAQQQSFQNRAHFFGACARAMRQILIRHAEKRNSQKRGGAWRRQPLDDLLLHYEENGTHLLELEEVLHDLEQEDDEALRLVELRVYAGVSFDECAELLQCSRSTLDRRWRWTRAWLRRALERES